MIDCYFSQMSRNEIFQKSYILCYYLKLRVKQNATTSKLLIKNYDFNIYNDSLLGRIIDFIFYILILGGN